MNKPVVSKEILRQWIIGAYAESLGFGIDNPPNIKQAQLAAEFARNVVRFMEEYNLLHPEIASKP